MTPNLRKFSLTVHITCSLGWIGAAFAYLALGIAAGTSHDPLSSGRRGWRWTSSAGM
jgi:hypothetical protein